MPGLLLESTRGRAPPVSLSEAIAHGLAADGGLYVPVSLPRIDVQDFASRENLAQIARRALAGFFEGDGLNSELGAIADAALNFPAPTTAVLGCTDPLYALELFHGPTAAFKDFVDSRVAALQDELSIRPIGQPNKPKVVKPAVVHTAAA